MKKLILLFALLAAILNAGAVQTPAQLPFTEDFENADSSSQWTIVNDAQINNWHIGEATHAGDSGSFSAYISDDNGVSNNYDINATSVCHITVIYKFRMTAKHLDYHLNGKQEENVLMIICK